MRSFAGTVCGLITISVYGMAIIVGGIYHNKYVAEYQAMKPNMDVHYSTDYFITWISILCAAAIISAIHHALWTIIDNQLELNSELGKQRTMLEEMRKVQGNTAEQRIGNDSQ